MYIFYNIPFNRIKLKLFLPFCIRIMAFSLHKIPSCVSRRDAN